MLSADELESLREAVRACGSLPRANDLDVNKLLHAMKGDKKSVAGQLKWVLLEKDWQSANRERTHVDRRA